MGCCISSDSKNTHSPNALSKPPLVPETDKTHLNNRAPPLCLEEETVKEVVLSESRLHKPQTHEENNTAQISIIREHSVEADDLINKYEEETSQVSQVSEIYSISESFSTTNTATTFSLRERKEDQAISQLTTGEVNHVSPAKVPIKQSSAGEVSRVAKPPAKRVGTSRVISRSDPGKTLPRNVGSTSGVRRENGEGSSIRRSRPPATRTTGAVSRRSPGKVNGRSGVTLRVENAGKEELNDGVLKETSELNEALDNPRVSLECFIFL